MAERIILPHGTIEHIIVDVSDRLKNLTDLAGTNARYSIRAKGAGATYILTNGVATTIGMSAYCLVDTTQSVYNSSNIFELFLQFDNLPESPRLGPFEFEVNA